MSLRKKFGRNDLCWCGSGLKYKKCHLGREKQEPLQPWQVDKEFKTAFSTRECAAPEALKTDCSNVIVKAHTVPKSGSLEKIARNGHVYGYVPGVWNLIKYQGRLQPQLIGINKASTFTGFCSVHDNAIFSKIEREPFVASQEQCFLLAYRALARELYTKRSAASLSGLGHELDRGKPLESQIAIQNMNFYADVGMSAGLRDMKYHKTEHDKVLLNKDFSNVRACVIELTSPPPIMCSAGMFPEQDFEGHQLQDLLVLERIPHLLNFTSFYGGDGGVIVFAWLAESDPACRKFIDSLRVLKTGRLTDGLIRFFFEFSENLHISPNWWDNLGDQKRKTLIDRATASKNPVLARKSACIAEDGIEFDNWPISNVRTVGF